MKKAEIQVNEIPVTGVRQFILDLAEAHNVTYVETPLDSLANVITRLSDDEVHLDEVENLLIALERAGIIPSGNVMPIHVNYLKEILNVQSL